MRDICIIHGWRPSGSHGVIPSGCERGAGEKEVFQETRATRLHSDRSSILALAADRDARRRSFLADDAAARPFHR